MPVPNTLELKLFGYFPTPRYHLPLVVRVDRSKMGVVPDHIVFEGKVFYRYGARHEEPVLFQRTFATLPDVLNIESLVLRTTPEVRTQVPRSTVVVSLCSMDVGTPEKLEIDTEKASHLLQYDGRLFQYVRFLWPEDFERVELEYQEIPAPTVIP